MTILIDLPSEFTWKLKTPWGIIEVYSGALVSDPFKDSGVAEYILETQIPSYKKYTENLARRQHDTH